MKESRQLAYWEAGASLGGILALVGCALPSYIEPESNFTLNAFAFIFGNERSGFNGLLFFAFLLILISLVSSLTSFILNFLEKKNGEALIMTLGIVSGIAALVGGAILILSFLVCDPYGEGGSGLFGRLSNYFIIMNQKKVTLGIGTFFPFIAGLASFIVSFPSALIKAHHADLKDKDVPAVDSENAKQ